MKNIKGLAKKPRYSEAQTEAATTLHGLKEMLAADPQKVVHEDEQGQQFTEQDYAASIVADRINSTPFYQKQFNIGGDTGRKVVGFQPLKDEQMRDTMSPEEFARLPDRAFVPIIENSQGKNTSTGPMTQRASSDMDDIVEYIDMDNLERMVSEA
ncbi:hypothetical protein KAR91_40080 [Candidatus Pacearchaeota archaeon]|nr:hypothetical protein [Candidatus Pacearchaeota archaeon]